MKNLGIFLYEWKHFIRSPFKIVALLLFVLSAIYGLHNGANLYKKQKVEIEKINQKVAEQQQKILAYYEKGEKGPKDRPWIDVTTPFWATWNVSTYAFKKPSQAMVYSIGQAEQYGFYKQISVWASPYDADMAEEISNPERLQSGTLDFSFIVLYLLPLLLLILLYNIKGAEAEQGFLPLIEVQTGSKNAWLLARVAFYGMLSMVVLAGLMFYGAMLTGVLSVENSVFINILLLLFFYLSFWTGIYFFILRQGKSSVINTLQMIGIWMLFAFIIPATVHQWVSIEKPANLMTDFIDVTRDGQEKLFSQPDSVQLKQLIELFPQISKSPFIKDSNKTKEALSFSASGLGSKMIKEAIAPIKGQSEAKNALIQKTYWFNPITFFQNQLNALTQTQYNNYENYRTDIQTLIDKRIKIMVIDIWNDVKVDKQKYMEYTKTFQENE
jgi:ABC-2 type transport system permease protein